MQYHTRYTITYPRKPTVGTVRFWQSRYWWLQPECSPSKVLPKTHNFFILFSKNKILPHKHHNFLSLCTAHMLISFLLSKNAAIVIFFSTNKQASFKILSYYTISKGKENHRRSETTTRPPSPGISWQLMSREAFERLRGNKNQFKYFSHHQVNIYPDQLNSWEAV